MIADPCFSKQLRFPNWPLCVVLQLAILAWCNSVEADELLSDLIVCADEPLRSFRVIEVVYESLDLLPCYTYVSAEDRTTGGTTETEQVAWARTTRGLCERSARKHQRTLEQSGYLCVTHTEDRAAVAKRSAAISPPPIVISMVGEADDVSSGQQDEDWEEPRRPADTPGAYRIATTRRDFGSGLPNVYSESELEENGH